MRQLKIATILLGLLMICVGCGNQKSETTTLTISAAASLTDCMEQIATIFNEEHPEVELQFNFGGSGTLQKQIEQGAPTDLFFSAGMKQMKALEEQGLVIEGSVEEVLSNRLVLIVPEGGDTSLTFENLAKSNISKMAIGEVESVPVGQYSVEVFNALGIMEQMESHLVYAKDVREVLTWVETGNVDAGIVYETDAKLGEGIIICDKANPNWHTSITYPIGIIKGTSHEREAQIFIDFLKSTKGVAILEEYGFTPED